MNKLKEMRLQRGFTQSKLAEQTGINVRLIQHYEQGTKNFDHARLDTIMKLCKALDCKISDILEDENYVSLAKFLGI